VHDTTIQDPLDVGPLAAWLDTQDLPGAGSPVSIEIISGGNQNIVARLRRGELQAVLRRPPRIVPDGRDDAMAREYRVLTALEGTDVPHARPIAFCGDHEVLGANFYVMDEIDGWSPAASYDWPAPYDRDVAARRGLAHELIGGIARLADVDWRQQGLGDFGRPDGFHERQVDRWMAHWSKFRFRDIPGIEAAGEWLRAHRPKEWTPGLMHGDYAFLNVMFRHGSEPELAAIVDWEMTTVGDPLLDLAWIFNQWPATARDVVTQYVDYSGMPLRDELVGIYEQASGKSVRDFVYYRVLAHFKVAIVLEGGYARFLGGEVDNPKVARYNDSILAAGQSAAALIEANR
jgi:aminoglycoside phosphotransferase (APT) family kinase protein